MDTITDLAIAAVMVAILQTYNQSDFWGDLHFLSSCRVVVEIIRYYPGTDCFPPARLQAYAANQARQGETLIRSGSAIPRVAGSKAKKPIGIYIFLIII
jgi:hypothetical protein